jgi:hypothetical protein
VALLFIIKNNICEKMNMLPWIPLIIMLSFPLCYVGAVFLVKVYKDFNEDPNQDPNQDPQTN